MLNNAELISVIIPVYNKEKFIKKCLDSVAKQSYGNIEILAINDGSKDSSYEILQECTTVYNNIIVINQENRGRSEARNEGIKKAKGRYMVTIDADDYVDPDYLSQLYQAIKKNNADCSICEMNIIGKYNRVVHITELEKETIDKNFIARFIRGNGYGYGSSSCNKMFDLDIIKAHNIQYPNIEVGEDFIFCLRYAYYSSLWCTVRKPLYNYVQNSGSTMHKFNENLINTTYQVSDNLEAFAKEYNLVDQLKEPISTAYIKLIFKEAVAIYSSKKGTERYRRIRALVNNKGRREKLRYSVPKRMTTRYRIFYYLYINKCTMMILGLLKAYMSYAGGTVS